MVLFSWKLLLVPIPNFWETLSWREGSLRIMGDVLLGRRRGEHLQGARLWVSLKVRGSTKTIPTFISFPIPSITIWAVKSRGLI